MGSNRRDFLIFTGASALASSFGASLVFAPRSGREVDGPPEPKHEPGRRVEGLTSFSQEAVVVGTLSTVRTMAGNTDARRFLIAWPKTKPKTVTISTSRAKVWPKIDVPSTRAQADAQREPTDVVYRAGSAPLKLGDLWNESLNTWNFHHGGILLKEKYPLG